MAETGTWIRLEEGYLLIITQPVRHKVSCSTCSPQRHYGLVSNPYNDVNAGKACWSIVSYGRGVFFIWVHEPLLQRFKCFQRAFYMDPFLPGFYLIPNTRPALVFLLIHLIHSFDYIPSHKKVVAIVGMNA
mgnify:CR=1 FL=1